MNVLKKLGFDSNIILDEELRKELLNLAGFLLGKYKITSRIHQFVFSKNDEKESFLNVSEGINYKKDDYNFMYVFDKAYNQIKIIIRPINQNSFSEENFHESLLVSYNITNNSLIINHLYKEMEDLISELYMYVRNNKNNDLALGIKKRIYDGNMVKNQEKNNFEELYHEGHYQYEDIVNPYFDKLFLVSKNSNGQKLSLNKEDTCFILHDGIVIYDYKNTSKKPTIISRFNETENSNLLFNMYYDYQIIGQKLDMKDQYTKRKN